jgi:hypothetical protein
MKRSRIVSTIALCHVVLFGVVLLRQPSVPDEISRIRPTRPLVVQPHSDGGMSMSFSSYSGTALFGRDYQIAYSGLLLRGVTALALPAFVFSLAFESMLIAHTDLPLGTRSFLVGGIFLLGLLLQWFAIGWLWRRCVQPRSNSALQPTPTASREL